MNTEKKSTCKRSEKVWEEKRLNSILQQPECDYWLNVTPTDEYTQNKQELIDPLYITCNLAKANLSTCLPCGKKSDKQQYLAVAEF